MLPALVAVLAGLAAGLAAGRRPPASAGSGWGAGWVNGRPAGWLWGLAAGAVAALVGRLVTGDAGVALLCLGYAVLAATALAGRRHPGMVLVAAGLLANLMVVAVDGGMPVRGLPAGAMAAGHHHGLGPRDRLTGLGDDVRLPAVGITLSAGDLVACAGGAVAAFAWLEPSGTGSGTRPGRSRRHRQPA